MAKKTILALIFILGLIASSFVLAETDAATAVETFSEQSMYNWLETSTSDGSYNSGDVWSTAWAALALAHANLASAADNSLSWLDSNMNAENCWPAQSCSTKETALVMYAKYLSQHDIDAIKDYFKKSMIGSTSSGEWLLEVITDSTGECKISYNLNDQTEEKTLKIEQGKFTDYGNNNFLNLNTALRSNLIKSQPNLELNIDCSGLETLDSITLVYKTGNTFYIVDSKSESSTSLTIPNGCFGRAAGDRCNAEASMYAAWVLNEVGSDLDISVYLREAYDENDPTHNALLYFISKDPSYLAQLKKIQSPDGSFKNNVLATALAVKAWNDDPTTYETDIQEALRYIKSRQQSDGSINSNVVDTASAIYGAFGFAVTSSGNCNDGIQNGDERGVDCGGRCEQDFGQDCCDNGVTDIGEDGIDCGGVCEPCETEELTCNNDGYCDSNEDEYNCPGDCKPKEVCVVNGICDTDYGETVENCPDDCKEEPQEEVKQEEPKEEDECGDGVCGDTEDEESCPDDCKTSSGFGTVILIILILALLGGGGYFAYSKGLLKFGGKPSTPSQPYMPQKPYSLGSGLPPRAPSSGMPPRAPIRRPAPQSTTSKLDKSLEEAKKLLGK